MPDTQNFGTTEFLDGALRYKENGAGEAVLLVHGYLESGEIWSGFSEALEKNYRVVQPDLPGHGGSDVLSTVHTMELLAEAVKTVLDDAGIRKVFMVGHSLGGYVTLAFLELYPERLNGFCLFHAHPVADTPETRWKREREIRLIDEGKKELIYNTNIPNAFADANLKRMGGEISFAKTIAANTPDEGIKAMLRGMMQRPDRTGILEETGLPFLWILGRHDNYIPYEMILEKVQLPKRGRLVTLENSGHQGFMEEPGEALEALSGFIKAIF